MRIRIHRLVLATIAALLCFAVAAVAQTTEYSIRGSVTVKGGTKKKPKAGGLTFGFSVTSPDGTQPPPLQTYSIGFEGGRMNLGLLKACTATKLNAAGGDPSVCPSGSKFGSGTLKVVVGSVGQPLAAATATCDGDLTLYAAGKKNAALLVDTYQSRGCPAEVHQAIDMTYVVSGGFAALQFTVPDELRHQAGLDLTVVDTDVKLPKIVKKKGKKKVGFLESTGCKGAERHLKVTFTDETGQAFPVEKSLGKC